MANKIPSPMSLRKNGWGYYPVDPKFKGKDFREGLAPMFYVDEFDYSKTYVLVGCEPDRMFKPGTEPAELDFFWWDNSMQPWLRHITPANTTGHKLWSRLTYKTWCMTEGSPALEYHRQRVNCILQTESQHRIKDISDLWGGTQATRVPKRKHALICASSERNHREFYNETRADWINRVIHELKKQGYTYTVRNKVGVNERKRNQTTDQIQREGCDLLIANHSATASEAVVVGVPIVTTSEWNPARDVSTTWEEFQQGIVKQFSVEEIEHWVTRICAYTYFRTELNDLSWIDVHPDAQYLKEQRYGT